jgi:uncharacterized protein YbjT (DUF2867 family)
MSLRILVTGASGYIGGRLVPRLLEEGHQVSVLVRNPQKIAERPWISMVRVFQGDVLQPDSLDEALKNIDVAYYFVHSMTSEGGEFSSRDADGAANFARASKRQKVQRIIYLGGLGITGSGLSEHLRSRHETGSILREEGPPVTELRAAIIVGSQSASFVIIRDLVRRLPIMICPRWVNTKCEPISIRQLLAYLVGVLSEPRSVGEILEVGGGEVLTYEQMMRGCAQVMGRRPLIFHVPVLTPNLSSYWLNLVTQVPFRLAKPLVEGLKNDVICNDFRIREWIEAPELSYKQAVELALAREREKTYISSWVDATTSSANEPVPDDEVLNFTDKRSCMVDATPEDIFAVVESIGGGNGWYHANWLWKLRAFLDWIIGGVGMRRGRPERLFVGAALDFWRVEEIERPHRLTLRAEMALPGVARLSFDVEPVADASRVTLKARFWPKGVLGKVYWYSVLPLHGLVFNGLLREIKRRSELGCSEWSTGES